jgi:hypothetical protein
MRKLKGNWVNGLFIVAIAVLFVRAYDFTILKNVLAIIGAAVGSTIALFALRFIAKLSKDNLK